MEEGQEARKSESLQVRILIWVAGVEEGAQAYFGQVPEPPSPYFWNGAITFNVLWGVGIMNLKEPPVGTPSILCLIINFPFSALVLASCALRMEKDPLQWLVINRWHLEKSEKPQPPHPPVALCAPHFTTPSFHRLWCSAEMVCLLIYLSKNVWLFGLVSFLCFLCPAVLEPWNWSHGGALEQSRSTWGWGGSKSRIQWRWSLTGLTKC